MNKDHSDTLFTIAEEMLKAAEHEKERSEEDVVTHLICVNSRQSLTNYLAGFLLRRDIDIEHPVTLTSLLLQCRSVDARFDTLSLNEIHCRKETHDRDYCLEPEQVDACMQVALQARDIVMSETPGY